MTSGNKLSRIIAVFLCAALAFSVITIVYPGREVQAASYSVSDWGSGCKIEVKGKKGESVTVSLSSKVDRLDHVKSIDSKWGCAASISDKTKIKINITENWGTVGLTCSYVKKSPTKAPTKKPAPPHRREEPCPDTADPRSHRLQRRLRQH